MPVKYKKDKTYQKAYVVSVDMGYGHQRAVHPLRDIAACHAGCSAKKSHEHIITANNYAGIPKRDRSTWEGSRKLYETISRMKKIPIIGPLVFGTMDRLQQIQPFYPKRDLSKPIMQVKQMYRWIDKGWGKHLIDLLNENPLPLITSFFTVAFFAEEHKYKGDIYTICTDTDISRSWAPLNPRRSRIIYLAPNKRVRERLELYGVREKNIFVTGFPLPKENIGGKSLEMMKRSIGHRIINLDPQKRYRNKYRHTLEYYLGKKNTNVRSNHPLTITFAVGGAGAQRAVGITILDSLHKHIDKGRIRLNLVAGSRNDVYRYYMSEVKRLHLNKKHSGSINIIYDEDKNQYFKEFNKALMKTDILWTKPSELSFYAGLGVPIIMAPAIGSQEDFNKAWLHSIGAGFEQEDPRYTHEWLFDWLESGWLAEAAMQGFLDAPRNGAYHIEDIVLRGEVSEIEDMHLL